ncbi:GNAT family N-acetyltransferase [Phytomonospora endophytica]|uniref:GNAT superfamily N-acetyltransferase n=1 Tax=Phytomonospora endophytica TaxID=714109 RepID=A0A841G5K6_9ACTN|nr:GNAT family N-acetyltransferase [Phytomonospora endophytica]MBB6039380.1 GNAT superfamily N-acetyltransferase [Phytomonospora endophytica]GIG69677.1 GNAT family N-acetyltransferase [Phytomonospora endophytica]
MTDIKISTLSATDLAGIDQWLDTIQSSWRVDLPLFPAPSKPNLMINLMLPTESTRTEYLTAIVDDRVVGVAEVSFPLKDNLHLVEFELDVHPEYRRRGVATALLRRIEELGAADGRRTYMIYAPDRMREDYPEHVAGKALLEKNGYVKGLDEVRRTADLDLVPAAELDAMLARAWEKAEGYELVQWVNHAPDDVVDGIAYLDGRLLQDAPMGTLDMEPMKVDAERIREGERRSDTRGSLRVNTVVRHIESGTVAGWTDIVVHAGVEEHAWQGITIVDPDHRGHRIGTIVKIVNHRFVRDYRPHVKYVHTWNAEENDFMISINEAIGYRVQERWVAYQKKV